MAGSLRVNEFEKGTIINITHYNVLGGQQRPKLLSETLSVLEQPRCAIEYVPRPPLADSDHEIVLVKGGESQTHLMRLERVNNKSVESSLRENMAPVDHNGPDTRHLNRQNICPGLQHLNSAVIAFKSVYHASDEELSNVAI